MLTSKTIFPTTTRDKFWDRAFSEDDEVLNDEDDEGDETTGDGETEGYDGAVGEAIDKGKTKAVTPRRITTTPTTPLIPLTLISLPLKRKRQLGESETRASPSYRVLPFKYLFCRSPLPLVS